ncbi:unnamed protein product [Adineta steineri]|uniref:Uncharacterized protein n=1 Tax=Adineta steineri TaxID=433720 RepID=A0A818TWJ7_9BILA|nr:unnamed protein product [Adineta steineri]CAF3689778.1 unnamed protein product [Adineta steineri]CAF3969484.1 unnamed protein product [Adineta steineri]
MNSRMKYNILSQLSFLSNLVSLTIKSICGQTMSQFNLPNLKKLVFSSCKNINWIQNFSQLDSIEYTIIYCSWHVVNELKWPLKLKHFRVIFNCDVDSNLIRQSLVQLSSLSYLEIYQDEKGSLAPDGQLWENLIQSSFPLLKIFKFYFQFDSYSSNRIEEIVSSFSTPFYIIEHKWFICCETSSQCGCGILYSLPFPYHTYPISKNYLLKKISTLPQNNQNDFSINMFTNVKTLNIRMLSAKPDENFVESNLINLVIMNHFESIKWIHLLTKLRHLELSFYTKLSSKNFLCLLNNTPQLNSLVAEKCILQIATEYWNNIDICKHLSRKILSLKLGRFMRRSQSISRNEIEQIIRIFSSKCQHLSLYFKFPDDKISFILQNMPQLYTLHVNIYGKTYSTLDIKWLEKQQTTFNASNSTIVINGHDHYFWLDKTLLKK